MKGTLTECPSCQILFSWATLPIKLRCNHMLCNKCIQNSFESTIKRNIQTKEIEIICLQCHQSFKYVNNQYGLFDLFFRLNFEVDYCLLSTLALLNPSGRALLDSLNPELNPEKPYEESEKSMIKNLQSKGKEIYVMPNKKSIIINEDDNEITNSLNFDDSIDDTSKPFKIHGKKQISCSKCNRIYNKRNQPIILNCKGKHKICEYCHTKMAHINMSSNELMIHCPFEKSISEKIKLDEDLFFPFHVFIRRYVKIDENLLNSIYEKYSIDAKKAAFEFSVKYKEKNVQNSMYVKCVKCYSDFSVTNLPRKLECNHYICLKCLNLSKKEGNPIKCKYDSIETDSIKILLEAPKRLIQYIINIFKMDEEMDYKETEDDEEVELIRIINVRSAFYHIIIQIEEDSKYVKIIIFSVRIV